MRGAISITVDGDKELAAALKSMSRELTAEVDAVVMRTAADLEADVKLRHQQSARGGAMYFRIYDEKTGYTNIYAGDSEGYVTSIKGRTSLSETHKSSAPGEAPAPDTGGLLTSIYHERNGPLSATAGSRLAYSMYLEFGTTQMSARPMWRPAAEAMAPEFRLEVENVVRRLGK